MTWGTCLLKWWLNKRQSAWRKREGSRARDSAGLSLDAANGLREGQEGQGPGARLRTATGTGTGACHDTSPLSFPALALLLDHFSLTRAAVGSLLLTPLLLRRTHPPAIHPNRYHNYMNIMVSSVRTGTRARESNPWTTTTPFTLPRIKKKKTIPPSFHPSRSFFFLFSSPVFP